VGYIVRRTIGSHLGITPWVRVRDTGTCMLESACGSGSLAVALLSSHPSASVIQPSGSVYEVRSDADVLRIRGAVRYLGTHTL
jgi:diaminopimelate epimerase